MNILIKHRKSQTWTFTELFSNIVIHFFAALIKKVTKTDRGKETLKITNYLNIISRYYNYMIYMHFLIYFFMFLGKVHPNKVKLIHDLHLWPMNFTKFQRVNNCRNASQCINIGQSFLINISPWPLKSETVSCMKWRNLSPSATLWSLTSLSSLCVYLWVCACKTITL